MGRGSSWKQSVTYGERREKRESRGRKGKNGVLRAAGRHVFGAAGSWACLVFSYLPVGVSLSLPPRRVSGKLARGSWVYCWLFSFLSWAGVKQRMCRNLSKFGRVGLGWVGWMIAILGGQLGLWLHQGLGCFCCLCLGWVHLEERREAVECFRLGAARVPSCWNSRAQTFCSEEKKEKSEPRRVKKR